MAYYIATKGVSYKVYTLRAKILRDIFKPEKLPERILRINCYINIGSLAPKLMKAFPSTIETTVCSSKYCPKKEMTMVIHVLIIQVKTQENGVECMEQLTNEIRRTGEYSACS